MGLFLLAVLSLSLKIEFNSVTTPEERLQSANTSADPKEAIPLLGLALSSASETTEALKSSQNNVSFAVISDIHILSSETAPMKFRTALEDLFVNQQPPLDLVVLNGDLGDGTPEDYLTLSQILRSVRTNTGKTTPIVPTIGNHEFYKAYHDPNSNAWNSDTFPNQDTDPLAIQRFLDFAGRSQVYTDHYINGFHFIFLGSEKSRMSDLTIGDAAYLSETQLTWLKSKISENLTPGKPVFVFLHQPIFSSNSKAQRKYNLVVQQKELAEILQSVPNVVLFVGHLHIKLGSPDSVVYDTFTMFNDASASRVRQAPEASQGLVVAVKDGVVNVKGRDFLKHEWLPEAQYQLDFSK
ncbi:metallophosphoesterase family protein [Desulfosporosinus hippei]|uniref:3',5'-cyclic AMP phosphodiesterase CpdA n=1 Tax=Desulfosporosinus hippei DSM 8344 TaxID=1121419 RepID=A0A1G8I9I5_9FIRM|nr:metallophosphoesterase [Desulfosporosinus hippei]SDI15639.1 3',5'-cyclic AMP phosphodiesterase CpdA [Desulfosporosinus hippei DSM 8344]